MERGQIQELTLTERRIISAAAIASTLDEMAVLTVASRRYIEASVGRLVRDGFLLKLEPEPSRWLSTGNVRAEDL